MAHTLATLLKLISEKTGLDLTDKAFADLLASNAPVPDEAYGKIKAGLDSLMDESGAKNNDTLHKHFKALALAPVDKKLFEKLEALGLDDDFKAAFTKSTNTYDKVNMLIDKAVEATESKVKAQFDGKKMSDDEKKKFTDEVARLNSEVLKTRAEKDAEVKAIKGESESAILNYAINSLLESKTYAQDALPKKVNAMTALNLLNEELKTKGAKVVRNADGSIKLIRSDNPDLDYTENNQPLTFDALVDSTLAKHNMLKVSDPKTKSPGNTQQTFVPADQSRGSQSAQDANQKQLEELNKALS